jgi:cytoskeletal protein CcmA (bactofilin family)
MKKTDEINAFLGKDTEFEGKLSFVGAVRIDGHFKGEINSDGTLIVGETAVIEAEVRVSYVIVSGEIRGNVLATKRVEIHSPGKVFGNLCAPTVVMDEGVVFEGSCSMQEARTLEDDNPATPE